MTVEYGEGVFVVVDFHASIDNYVHRLARRPFGKQKLIFFIMNLFHVARHSSKRILVEIAEQFNLTEQHNRFLNIVLHKHVFLHLLKIKKLR